MAELSRRSDVSVATIKYYLRQGLLQPGARTQVNQADYEEDHVARLRLVRALTDLAGLPLAEVRTVLDALDARTTVMGALAAVQDSLASVHGSGTGPGAGVASQTTGAPTEQESPGDGEAARLVRQVVAERGWRVGADSPAFRAAVSAVDALRAAGANSVTDRITGYAAAAETVGYLDVDALQADSSDAGTAHEALVGTLLRRPLLDALILLAQQDRATERFGTDQL